jgi:hypothetical protein
VTDAEPISDRRAAPPAMRSRPLRAGCAICAIGSLTWAFWPLRATVLAIPPKPLDLAAFRTPLWVAPPPPPAPPAPQPPPPPFRLQLIAIISDAGATKGGSAASNSVGVRAALLYDPDQDKLFTVHQGETLNGRTIERITEKDVLIRDGAGARTLALRFRRRR